MPAYLQKYQHLFTIITILFLLAFFNIRALTNHIQEAHTISQSAIKKVTTTEPKVAITFDDGPSPLSTPKYLDVLRTKNVKATFFILGKSAETYPELLQEIVADGHELGNHTYSHSRLARMPAEDVKAELNHTDAIILNITGQKVRFVRPPENSYNDALVELTNQFGYTFVLWSVDTRDWTSVSRNAIIQKIEKTQPGDIILFHEGVRNSKTAEALPEVIDILQKKGFQLVTLSELLQAK